MGGSGKVPVELTPEWWRDKILPKDHVVIIPDTEYPSPMEGTEMDYGGSGGRRDVDYNTGVVVLESINDNRQILGHWAFYSPRGCNVVHPFRERFSHGRGNPLADTVVLIAHKDRILLVTDKKIF